MRVCDRCVNEQHQEMEERQRAAEAERARARQQAVVEEQERQRQRDQIRKEQEHMEQIRREKVRIELQKRQIEEKYLGPRPLRPRFSRSQSHNELTVPSTTATTTSHNTTVNVLGFFPDEMELFILDAEQRAKRLRPKTAAATTTAATTAVIAPSAQAVQVVKQAEECAICLELMEVGNAIFTTACGHSFHWSCLKEIQKSDVSNCDKCPACRAEMHDLKVKKQCDHPRVRTGHRFCRDCGGPVIEKDVKLRPNETGMPPGGSQTTSGPGGLLPPINYGQPASYRASPQGALVRCPQCQIQMRILPHMYNMRVACPSGHMFLVELAGSNAPAPGGLPRTAVGGGPGSFGGGLASSGIHAAHYSHGGNGVPGVPGLQGIRPGGPAAMAPSRNINSGYPGATYYRG